MTSNIRRVVFDVTGGMPMDEEEEYDKTYFFGKEIHDTTSSYSLCQTGGIVSLALILYQLRRVFMNLTSK